MRSARSLNPRAVYFIKPVGMSGPVKIGTTIRIEWRLSDLSASSPIKLEMWALLPGDFVLERQFHAYFADSHSHGEWFHWSPKLEETVQAILNGTFSRDVLPRGVRVDYKPKNERPAPRQNPRPKRASSHWGKQRQAAREAR